MNTNKLSLGIVGGGPKSWIGHVCLLYTSDAADES